MGENKLECPWHAISEIYNICSLELIRAYYLTISSIKPLL
jgi:hypothetical protein